MARPKKHSESWIYDRVFAAIIEWPVLWRTRTSGDPFKELSKIDPAVLKRAALGSLAAGLVGWLALG